jgi:putative DNA primase/helicase
VQNHSTESRAPKSTDLWVVRRLLIGSPVNGEMEGVSAEMRPLADRLAKTPHAERSKVFSDWGQNRSDNDAVIRALSEIDPAAPCPDDEPKQHPGPKANLICAAGIKPRAVEWLWRDRVPLGMLSMFGGDPKLGKSLVTLALAANVSRGAPMPSCSDIPDGPASVVLMSAEDDPSRTIVPRLRAAGAILQNVHILESIVRPRDDDGPPIEHLPCLKSDLAAIESAVAGLGDCRLVVIDPVSAYLGQTDDHKNAELRGLLSPLKALAERLNVAVVLVSHLTKAGGVNGKHRVQGSIAWVGAYRANYLFMRDPDDSTGQKVLMLDNGCNLAPTQDGLAYVIKDRGDGPAVEWLEDIVNKTADSVLLELAQSQMNIEKPEQAAQRKDCEEWLREFLSGGPVNAKDVQSVAKQSGHSPTTLHRAKHNISIVTSRAGFGRDMVSYWSLPSASTNAAVFPIIPPEPL